MKARLLSGVLGLLMLMGLAALEAHRRTELKHAVRDLRTEVAAANQALRDSERALALAQEATQAVIDYVDRIEGMRQRRAALAKEIPTHVTPKADAACTVPAGFVRLHDAAALDTPLDPGAGDPDAPAAGLTLSAVAETTADNYATCHAVRAQLMALQQHVRSMDAAFASEPAP